ncbi:hypothetical protein LJR030_001671 [Rhizobium sp. LjRoot30]|uniref:hypothetical protein n=1 Tax=Rhizobium sp. LjRoot30 TaxID=3342320 RepID=UPI003ECEDFF3
MTAGQFQQGRPATLHPELPDSNAPEHFCDAPVATWRGDIDALQFTAAGHGGVCMIHRLAFRSLVGRMPESDDCLAYFSAHAKNFAAAARQKIAAQTIQPGRNFHLNSRDIRRALAGPSS